MTKPATTPAKVPKKGKEGCKKGKNNKKPKHSTPAGQLRVLGENNAHPSPGPANGAKFKPEVLSFNDILNKNQEYQVKMMEVARSIERQRNADLLERLHEQKEIALARAKLEEAMEGLQTSRLGF